MLANYAFLNFDLLSLRSLNFPKISAPFLIGPFFIIGDFVYIFHREKIKREKQRRGEPVLTEKNAEDIFFEH